MVPEESKRCVVPVSAVLNMERLRCGIKGEPLATSSTLRQTASHKALIRYSGSVR
jgi:hypothetical protein